MKGLVSKAVRALVAQTLFVGGVAIAPNVALAKKDEKAMKVTKVKAPKLQPLKKRVKIAKSKSGISFLTAEQVAILPYNQRVQYVKYFREMYRDFEKFQRVFDPNPAGGKSAHLPGERDIYAAFFGGYAFAEDQAHDQGNNCQDRCIYAYHLSEYKRGSGGSCVRYPYGCREPQACQRGGGSRGLACNFIVSGLQGQDACIDYGSRTRSTAACEENRQRVIRAKRNDIQSATNQAGEYFQLRHGIDHAAANLTNEQLWPEDQAGRERITGLIQGLVNTLYSDESYAQLLVITELYKRKGLTLPPVTVNGEPNTDVQNLGRAFNNLQSAADELFAGYTEMCNQNLSSEVVASLRDDAVLRRLRGSNRIAQQQRRENLQQVTQSGGTPTNRNVLQKEECFLVDSRLGTMRDRLRNVATGLPVPPPAQPTRPENYVYSLGCRTSTPREPSGVEQPAARCLTCPLEKLVHHDPQANDPSYMMSNKWSALVSTMGIACGYGSAAGIMDVGRMAEMYQTFGHCSTDTYDWNSEDEKRRARRFGQRNYWTEPMVRQSRRFLFFKIKGKSIPQPDVGDEFARVFGISYYEATALFCDPDNFRGDMNRAGYMDEIKGIVSASGRAWSRDDATRPRRTSLGRQRMQYALENYRTESVRAPATDGEGLAQCMRESLNRAQRYYQPDSRMCLDAGPLRQHYAQAEREALSEQSVPPVIFTGSDCWTANQVEHTAANPPALAFLEPSELGHDGLHRRTVRDPYLRPPVACYTPNRECRTGASDAAVATYQITYMNQRACLQEDITMTEQRRERRNNK